MTENLKATIPLLISLYPATWNFVADEESCNERASCIVDRLLIPGKSPVETVFRYFGFSTSSIISVVLTLLDVRRDKMFLFFFLFVIIAKVKCDI